MYKIAIFLSVAFAVMAGAIASKPQSRRHDVLLALEQALPSSSDPHEPGYVLSVLQQGRPLFQVRSGSADIEQARMITDDSVFHVASLSKQITAAALAHALMDGLISLDDPVGKWEPGARKYGDELTIAHLVYMTSGLTEYTDLPGPGGRPWATFHYFTIDDAIAASLSVDDLLFAPGSEWRYSNTNYMLIARIIGKAYGQPFADVVRLKIFEPLGMSSSLINDDVTTIIPNRANAYLPRSEPVLTELASGAGVSAEAGEGLVMIRRNAPHYGGSGVMTSMADWTKWQNELLTRSVFGDEFWSIMTGRRSFDHDKSNDAFGLVHGRQNGQRTLWYAGGDIDASSYAITFLDKKISISCFSNNPIDSCEQKALRAANAIFGRLPD